MPQLITVTSASGKQGAHVLPHLASNPSFTLRLVVNSSTSRDRLAKEYPNAEVVTADLRSPADCSRILESAHTLYYIAPATPFEPSMGQNIVNAAQSSGLTHFVHASVLNTQLSKLINHNNKRPVEEALLESGVPYTILSPSNFMDRFDVPAIVESGSWTAAWNPDNLFATTSLADMGEVGAKVVAEGETHYWAQYQIVSSPPRPYMDFIREVEKQSGKKIEVRQMDYTEAFDKVVPAIAGADEGTREIIERLVLYYNRRGLKGSPNTLRWLLGREPTSVEEYVRRGMKKLEDKA